VRDEGIGAHRKATNEKSQRRTMVINTLAIPSKISNAPYPVENYTVSVNDEATELILRTKNKKFYKKWRIPGMVRAGEKVSSDGVSLVCPGNPEVEKKMVLSYTKPEAVLAAEEVEKVEREKSLAGQKSGDKGNVECKQS